MLREIKDINFLLDHRVNTFKPNSEEWALNVRLGSKDSWTVYSWNKKPSRQTISMLMEVIPRVILVYIKSVDIKLPLYTYEGKEDGT